MEKFYEWLAYKLPRRLVYYCYVRLHAYATTTKYTDKTPYEVSWDMALKAWTPKADKVEGDKTNE